MTSIDQQIDLVINRLKRAQYEELYQQGKIDETQLYLITDDPDVSSVVSTYLSDYYPKSETSSAVEIFNAISSIPLSDYAKVSVDNEAVQDFKMLHIGYDEYARLVADEQVDPHTMYMLSADGYDDQFGNRIANLGEPEASSDAATKKYVDDAIQQHPKVTKIIAGSNITISPEDGTGEVTISATGGSGGGGTWGSIEGNVEDQTDLLSVNYPLDNPAQSSEVVSEITYKRFDIKDHTIATISLSDATPVRIHFPPKPTANFCRDFIVKIKVTSETMPQMYFVKADNDTDIGFEYADEDWTTLEAGINYFTFTETERS